MQFALFDSIRVKAFPKGRARCEVCDSEVIAKCGVYYADHWAHKARRECDLWWETETEWHRQWKEKFPENWREIVIKRNDIMHRADVLTDKEVVIEFQNSPISLQELQAREAFYKRMLWVVNAESFKDRFRIISKVESETKKIDRDIEMATSRYDYELRMEIKKGLVDLNDLELEIENLEERVQSVKYVLESHRAFVSNKKQICDRFSEFLDYGVPYRLHDPRLINFKQWLKRQNDTELVNFWETETKLVMQRNDWRKYENQFSHLDNCKLNGIAFKFLTDAMANEIGQYSDRLFVIDKKLVSKKPHPVRKIQGMEDLENILSIKDNFHFLLKYEDEKSLIDSNILKIEGEIEALTPKREQMKRLLESKLDTWSEKTIRELEPLKSERVGILEEAKTRYISLKNKVKDLDSNRLKNLQEFKNEKELELIALRQSIQSQNQNCYVLNWGNQRRVWLDAHSVVLFDVGEDYLFKLTSKTEVKKINVKSFLSKYNGTSVPIIYKES